VTQNLRSHQLACVCIFAAISACCQSNLVAVPTITKDVNEVNLVFTAVDRRGRFVDDLSATQIDLRDEGLSPTAVHRFAVQTDQPLRVVILLDKSDSVTNRFDFEKAAAASFLNLTLRPAVDEAMVIGFDGSVRVYQDWTNDIARLRSGLQNIQVGGSTAFYDALVEAADRLRGQDTNYRRVIVVITDGQDTSSRATAKGAIEAALRAQATVYEVNTNLVDTVPLGPLPFVASANEIMNKIAEASGGEVLPGSSIKKFRAALARIDRELRNQYLYAYTPAAFTADGQFRRIQVKALHRRGVHIRARRGYYSR
jgi:Ca-activated chloride channel family protein